MILETESTTVVSNLPATKTVQMSINVAGMPHLMKILTNLYNDPKTAVIREYFANALDSHVAAGQTDPVLVSLPTVDNRNFVVQDFGLGMSVEDIETIYSQYGASTKRDSNDQIGAFGLGAKSALAIANQFTLTSVKDGEKVSVLIQKTPEGINTVTFIPNGDDGGIVSATDEPNGVTVSVPISDVWVFNSRATKFFQFADPETVLVDGRAPIPATAGMSEILDEDGELVGHIAPHLSSTSYVVMGGVPYELTQAEQANSGNRTGTPLHYNKFSNVPKYIPVPIGSVDLTPNREGLRFTQRTTDLVDAKLAAMFAGLRTSAQAEIDEVEDRAELGTLVRRWREFGFKDLKWNGEEIVETLTLKGQYSSIKRNRHGDSSHGQGRHLDVFSRETYIVTGQPFDKYRRISGYLTDYMKLNDIRDTVLFVFLEDDEELSSPWLTENSKFTFVTFQSIIDEVKEYRKANRPAKPHSTSSGVRRAKAHYRVLDVDMQRITLLPFDEVPAGTAYVDLKELADRSSEGSLAKVIRGRDSGFWLAERIGKVLPDVKNLLLLEGNMSVDAMLKRIPGAVNLATFIDEATNELRDSITPELCAAWSDINYGSTYDRYSRILTPLSAVEVDDAKIMSAIDAVKMVDEFRYRTKDYFDLINTVHLISTEVETVQMTELYVDRSDRDNIFKGLFENYPLVSALLGSYSSFNEDVVEHLKVYINTIHSTLVNA